MREETSIFFFRYESLAISQLYIGSARCWQIACATKTLFGSSTGDNESPLGFRENLWQANKTEKQSNWCVDEGIVG